MKRLCLEAVSNVTSIAITYYTGAVVFWYRTGQFFLLWLVTEIIIMKCEKHCEKTENQKYSLGW